MKRLITGNEAIGLGALRAGVKVIAGYPGTPSTGAIASLLAMKLVDTHVEWSTNEKVAFEIATGVAWAGHRALCTMKMSGLNVAYDSVVSVAHSGVESGLVVYVADDPGASAGMVEQDSRGFALMCDMPMLEPATVREAFEYTKYAFELSERTKTPVFVRLVTGLSNTLSEVDVEEPAPVSQAEALLIHDINRFTKAGPVIAMTQHQDVIRRLGEAGRHMHDDGLNRLELAVKKGGVGVVAVGVTASYYREALEVLSEAGIDTAQLSFLKPAASVPFAAEEARALLGHCRKVLVLEELDPVTENELYVLAQQTGWKGDIIGKRSGHFSRVGEYGLQQVVSGVATALDAKLPEGLFQGSQTAAQQAAARPITVCAGCPHRGVFMAINTAIRRNRYKPEQVMVTGDIGCTILGMNPPFNTVWNEISMGASVSLAQGFVYAGVKTPVIATMGDSTFFHAGIPGLINAVQQGVNLTLIIMDNYWTAMTGMQVNPGTPCEFYGGCTTVVDIARIVPALGVEQFYEVDPFDYDKTLETIQQAMNLQGVKVILARRECAIAMKRRTPEFDSRIRVVDENCNLCKLCVMITGCPAISLGEKAVEIDYNQCTVCGLCIETCNRAALVKEPI